MLSLLRHSLLRRAALQRQASSSVVLKRLATSSTAKPQRTSNMPIFKKRKILLAASGVAIATASVLMAPGQANSDDLDDSLDKAELSLVPFRKLVSGWIAFAFCSSPTWVDASERVYSIVSNIPIISPISHKFVMYTFFEQFLGGETTEECIPKIEALRQHRIGTLLGYNIEAKLDGSSKEAELIATQTKYVLESIETQGMMAKKYRFGAGSDEDGRFWVRIKVSGLVSHPIALFNGSNAILRVRKEQGLDKDVPHPGLPHDGDWEAALAGPEVTDSDKKQLASLESVLRTIGKKAQENRVRVVIDAEQSWYQPVIDSLTEELMQDFNTLGSPPTFIASFQAYLRRYPQLLDQQIRRARDKGYKLLFKQVRGAYMVTEAARWAEEGRKGTGPVWETKEETDASYDYGIEKAIALLADETQSGSKPSIGAIFATHNSTSVQKAIQQFEKLGLAQRRDGSSNLYVSKAIAESVTFGQLYGMKDDLTNKIIGAIEADDDVPLAIKSMSYGDLEECLPFLARRATENKAVLEGRGGALAERVRLGREVRRRLRLSS